jgi:hypothetical protein
MDAGDSGVGFIIVWICLIVFMVYCCSTTHPLDEEDEEPPFRVRPLRVGYSEPVFHPTVGFPRGMGFAETWASYPPVSYFHEPSAPRPPRPNASSQTSIQMPLPTYERPPSYKSIRSAQSMPQSIPPEYIEEMSEASLNHA